MDIYLTIIKVLKICYSIEEIDFPSEAQQAFQTIQIHIAEQYPSFDLKILKQDTLNSDQERRLAYQLRQANADEDLIFLQLLLQVNQALFHQSPDVATAIGVSLQDVRANDVTISDVYVTQIQGRQPPEPGEPPYKGLEYFDVNDSDLFFGREELIAELVDYLRDNRFMVVIGASGSGKSSLVRAGLIPTLQGKKYLEGSVNMPVGSKSWRYLLMTPTDKPLYALSNALVNEGGLRFNSDSFILEMQNDPLALHKKILEIVQIKGRASSGDQRVLLVIDQFEELFTQSRDTNLDMRVKGFQSRKAFVDNLLSTVAEPGSPTCIVITMRADFYGHCSQFDNLRDLLGDLRSSRQKFIGDMTQDEVRRAIERPLEKENWAIEPELVDQLLIDTNNEPGALPLLSHSLLETWNRRSGRLLTLAGYIATGRIQGAIAKTAEIIYQDELTDKRRSIAQNIFMRLTEPGEMTEDTRRRVDLSELITKPDNHDEIMAVLNILSAPKSRLIVIRAQQVEVAHEAIIREWPRLREWMEKHRVAYRQLREVNRAAKSWMEHDQKIDWLVHKGTRLSTAVDLINLLGLPMSQIEQNYVRECMIREHELDSAEEDLRLTNLGEMGWGILFMAGAEVNDLRSALGELLEHRNNQAGPLYREFVGDDGYQPGETARDFLIRHGVGSGRPNPEKMPYYLLLVGDPDEMPFSFQYQLDVQLAAGRIYFSTLDEYAQYARSVVTAEQEEFVLPRKAVIFGVENKDDMATKFATSELTLPLSDMVKRNFTHWDVQTIVREESSKNQLSRLIGGDETPALLFTVSHGMAFPNSDPQQLIHQGALLCNDWPGPREWTSPIPKDFYFAAEDVKDDARLLGSIFFFWGCYSAGTPRRDNYSFRSFQHSKEIAAHSFISNLPQRLLSHPKGGALAVIGRVERAWGYSFKMEDIADWIAFLNALAELIRERPVGLAVDHFNRRYIELSATLIAELEKGWMGEELNEFNIAGLKTASMDARNYLVIGDPFVRLRVDDPDQISKERPVIRPIST